MPQGDISLQQNFDLNKAAPLDAKTRAASLQEMFDLTFPYEGRSTHVAFDASNPEQTGKKYKLLDESLCDLTLGAWGKVIEHYEPEGTGSENPNEPIQIEDVVGLEALLGNISSPIVEDLVAGSVKGLHYVTTQEDTRTEKTFGFWDNDSYEIDEGFYTDISLLTESEFSLHASKNIHTKVGDYVFNNRLLGMPQTLSDLITPSGIDFNLSLFYQEIHKPTPNFCYVMDVANSPHPFKEEEYYNPYQYGLKWIRLPQIQNPAYDNLNVYTFINDYVENGSDYNLVIQTASQIYENGQLRPELSAINNRAHIARVGGADYPTEEAVDKRSLKWAEPRNGSDKFEFEWKTIGQKPTVNKYEGGFIAKTTPVDTNLNYTFFYNDLPWLYAPCELETMLENGVRSVYVGRGEIMFPDTIHVVGGKTFLYTLPPSGSHKLIQFIVNTTRSEEDPDVPFPVLMVETETLITEPLIKLPAGNTKLIMAEMCLINV